MLDARPVGRQNAAHHWFRDAIISTAGTPNGPIEIDITLLPKLCLSARPALEHNRELGLSIHEVRSSTCFPAGSWVSAIACCSRATSFSS